jgi:3',5'-cyclic-AMP phosphodiesterase
VPASPWLLAQISDLHIKAPGRLLGGQVDTAAFLRAAVEHLNRLDPQPDLVLASGDLVDAGGPEEYDHLHELLTPLRAPLLLLPGNHDAHGAFRPVHPDGHHRGDGPWCDVVVEGTVRVVALDTLRDGQAGGRLAPEQLAWLDALLTAGGDQPTVVALHHPPFDTGIGHMDAMGLDAGDARALGAVVRHHPQVERVLAGHVHRTITRRWYGTIAITAPSVAHAVALELRDGAPGGWALEPPAFLLHEWRDGRGLVTHVVPVGRFAGGPFG